MVYDPLSLDDPRFDMTEFKKPSLRELADEVACALEHGDAYLNRRTGDFATLLRAYLMERSRNGARSTLEPEIEQLIDDIDGTTDWVALPGSDEIDEWDIMRRFAESLENRRQGHELLEAIEGRGAFRRFRSKLDKFRLNETWYEFRLRAVAEIVRSFLEDEQIPFEDDL